MDHKERCKRLKAIRKKIADTIGVDLHQTECTYEGECRGTCPKCQQEEKKLQAALTCGTAAAAAVMLTACGMEAQPSSPVNNHHSSNNSCELTPADIDGDHLSPIIDDKYDPSTFEVDTLSGEVGIEPEEGEALPNDIEGGETDGGDEIIELAGDVSYVPDTDFQSEDFIIRICENITGAPIVEIDSVDGNVYTIHCYEIVGDHTATIDWLVVNTVDETIESTITGMQYDVYQYNY